MNSGSINIRRNLQTALSRAEELEKSGKREEAGKAWAEAGEAYRKLAKIEINQLEVTRLLKKAKACEEKAKLPSSQHSSATGDSGNSEEAIDSWRFTSKVAFNDIAGMPKVKQQLKYALGLQLAKQPDHIAYMELPSRICLYGPPGCGKTLLAAACANTLGAVFFNVKIPDLMSKYVGDSPKMIQALYRRAREVSDEGLAVVFIDEIDGLIVDRSKDHASHEKQVLNTFLAELDGLAEKNQRSSVITIMATNKPDSLDEAFMSRIDLKFSIGLPDATAREEIFRIHIERRGYKLRESSITYSDLATMTQGRSGREIQVICKKVLMNILASENDRIPELVDGGKIKDYTLRIRPFERTDFEEAFSN